MVLKPVASKGQHLFITNNGSLFSSTTIKKRQD